MNPFSWGMWFLYMELIISLSLSFMILWLSKMSFLWDMGGLLGPTSNQSSFL